MIWKPKPSANRKPKFKLLVTTAALSFMIVGGCTNAASDKSLADRDTMKADGTKVVDGDAIDFNSPVESYEEIRDTSIRVQENNKYAIYTLSNDILFDVDQSKIKKPAEDKLKMIGESLNKRFKGANIGIYGHADSTGAKTYNKELGRERATAVRDYLMKNADIAADKIAVVSFGETNAAATNATPAGRRQNRSVEIVVTKGLVAAQQNVNKAKAQQ